MHIIIPFHLSDVELLDALTRLAADERSAVAELIAHLAALDTRGAHLALGYSSLFSYCREALHLSEHEAYNRIEVARGARAFPEMLGMLYDGALTSTAARLLAPVLTAENRERLLAAAAYRSKREVEELIAGERPRPDVRPSVRRLPAARLPVSCQPAPGVLTADSPSAGSAPAAMPELSPRVSPPAAPARKPVVAPLSPNRYEVRFTASATTCEKLRLARDLLQHAVPDGNIGEIVDRALTLLIEQTERKRFALVRRPRTAAGQLAGPSREPPSDVKRRVYLRDGGRCAFVASGGRRCNSRAFLEFHHVTPDAVGGFGTVENIQLRCRAHNQYEADVYFGPVREARASVEDAAVIRVGGRNSFQERVHANLRYGQLPLE